MNVCARHQSGKNIRCCVSGTVVHRFIDIGRAEGKWLDVLAMVVRGARCPLIKHYDRVRADVYFVVTIQLRNTC